MRVVLQPEVAVDTKFDEPDLRLLQVTASQMVHGNGWSTMYYWLRAGLRFKTLAYKGADGEWIANCSIDPYVPDYLYWPTAVCDLYFKFADSVIKEAVKRNLIV